MIHFFDPESWLANTAIVGFVICLSGLAATHLFRQPARKLRILELAAAGLIACPLLALASSAVQASILATLRPGFVNPQGSPKKAGDAPSAQRRYICHCDGTEHFHTYSSSDDLAMNPTPREPKFDSVGSIGKTRSRSSLPSKRLTVVYLSGLFVLACVRLFGLAGLERIRKRSRKCEGRISTALRSIASGATDKALLLENDAIRLPITIGLRRPTIVLPRSWENESERSVALALRTNGRTSSTTTSGPGTSRISPSSPSGTTRWHGSSATGFAFIKTLLPTRVQPSSRRRRRITRRFWSPPPDVWIPSAPWPLWGSVLIRLIFLGEFT